ncbi:MAG: DNA pilot protein [Microviridae sp.]|nr:MAG: DNA pilot protein [Microviridae sp.]
MPILESLIPTVASAVIGQGLARTNDERQIRQQRKLNELEFNQSVGLMNVQKKNQLDVWEATGYKGQKRQMEEAGLNPALLYGGGGGGGTTVGGGIPISGGGNAPQGGGEIMGMLQMRAQEAQIELMKAQATKTEVEAKKIGGVDTRLGETQIESLTQGIANQKAIERLTEVQTELAETQSEIMGATKEEQIAKIGIEMQNAAKQLEIMTRNSWIDENTKMEKIKMVQTELAGMVIENKLRESQKQLTDEERRSISKKLAIDMINANSNQMNANTNAVNKETNVMNAETSRLAVGKKLQEAGMSTADIAEVMEVIGLGIALKSSKGQRNGIGFKPQAYR